MQWVLDEDRKVWNLLDNSSIIAKIFIKEKKENKRAYHAKTLISSIYFGVKIFGRLTKSKKEWKVYNKKFHTREDMEKYIEVKKHSVLKFVEKA